MKPAQLMIVSSADSSAIVTSASTLIAQLTTGTWLDSANSYVTDCITTIAQHRAANQFDAVDLAQYVAASTPLHCFDGWAFLGRSISALLSGDPYTAIHLAYYAELWAAMTILASAGIGTFNSTHIVFDAASLPSPVIGVPTHDFAWQALQHWASIIATQTDVTDIISDGSRTLTDWLQAFSMGYLNPSVANGWLKSWSIDISVVDRDRQSRNNVSYRPTSLVGSRRPDPVAAGNFAEEVWRAFEPGFGGFGTLDRHLIRVALEEMFELSTGQKPVDAAANYQNRIIQTLGSLGLAGSSYADWFSFLMRNDHRSLDYPILGYGRRISAVGAPNEHLEVISRAALLLRVSTGRTRSLLSQAGFSQSDLSNWILSEAVALGFWPAAVPLVSPIDLWQDVENLLNDLSSWDQSATATTSRTSLFNDLSEVLIRLGGMERVAMWGIY